MVFLAGESISLGLTEEVPFSATESRVVDIRVGVFYTMAKDSGSF